MMGACTYGRAVVASDVAEPGRPVAEQGLGLVSAPDDAASLAEQLHELLMAERALALARVNSWDAMARRFCDLFTSLTPPRRAS